MTPLKTNDCSSLKAVVYTDAVGVGGAEISLGHLVAHVSPEIEVTVLGVSQTVVDTIADNRPQAKRIVLPTKGWQAIASHIMTLHHLRPHIVHFNLCTPWACATGLTAALTLPNARVVRVDQLPLRTTDAIELWRTRALSLRVDAHVAVGAASSRRMEDFYALGRHTVISVPNGVPDTAANTLAPFTRKNDALVIGSIGRLDAMKGHDVLLQAIAHIDDIQVVILGEGEQRATLEQLAIDLGVRDRVSLPGWVDDPRAYLPTFDIFVLPSRSEGFPLAIVEAMLAALPVVATTVGSVAEAVIQGETGLLIEKDDVMGLVAALCCLKADAALRDRLGQRGREVAIARFTAQQMAKRYEQVWREVLAMPRSPKIRLPRPRD